MISKVLAKMDKTTAIYEFVEQRTKADAEFKDSVISMYKRNARWSNFWLRNLISGVAFFFRPQKKEIKYFFWGNKFEEIILDLNKKEVCVLGGPKQLVFCIKNGVKFLPVMGLWGQLLKGLLDGEGKLKGKRNIEKLLNKYSAKKSWLIVDNASLPMQRAMIDAFSLTGKSICIQHGIFQSGTPANLLDGWFADIFLVMDKSQRDLMHAKGMDLSKLKVMGFHSSPYIPVRAISSSSIRKLCFLGQPWARYGDSRGKLYLDILMKIRKLATKENFEFIYKPHPWETGLDYLNDIEGCVKCEMNQALENYDVFVSLTSTALLEAVNSGRVAIQIRDENFLCDDFSKFSSVKSLDLQNVNFEQDFKAYFSIEPPQIVNAAKPAQRFLSIIEGVM